MVNQSRNVYIAVMGVTGAGKSSFISLCSDQKAPVGHNLQGCTTTVGVYSFQWSRDTIVHLVDTPGFDDTNRSDTQVLREIAEWLTQSFSNNLKLNGIIYLHRISDDRMQGSAKRNLIMFNKLCGRGALKNVILGTTMWDKTEEAVAVRREKELIKTPDFWGWMTEQGSRVCRHFGTIESARAIIQYFTNCLAESHIVLDIQREMVNQQKNLNETSAGIELNREIAKAEAAARRAVAEVEQEMKIAIDQRDKEMERALKDVRRQYEGDMKRLSRQQEQLKVTMESMHKAKLRELENKMKQQEESHCRLLEEATEKQEDLITDMLRLRLGDDAFVSDPVWIEKSVLTDSRVFVAMGLDGSYIAKNGSGAVQFWDGNSQLDMDKWKRQKDDELVYADLYDSYNFFLLFRDYENDETYYMVSQLPLPFLDRIDSWARKAANTKVALSFGQFSYFAITSRSESRQQSHWNLDLNKQLAQDLTDNVYKVAKIALGVDDSYFMVTTENEWIWNLKGYYPKFEKFLENYLGTKTIFPQVVSVSLDPDGEECYNIELKGGKSDGWLPARIADFLDE